MNWREPAGGWRRSRYVDYSVIAFDDADASVVVARYAPNGEVPVHYHGTPYVSIVVDGQLRIGEERHETGDIRMVPAHTPYGPLQAGPAGCIVVDVFANGAGLRAGNRDEFD